MSCSCVLCKPRIAPSQGTLTAASSSAKSTSLAPWALTGAAPARLPDSRRSCLRQARSRRARAQPQPRDTSPPGRRGSVAGGLAGFREFQAAASLRTRWPGSGGPATQLGRRCPPSAACPCLCRRRLSAPVRMQLCPRCAGTRRASARIEKSGASYRRGLT